jgi:hypothetical protein
MSAFFLLCLSIYGGRSSTLFGIELLYCATYFTEVLIEDVRQRQDSSQCTSQGTNSRARLMQMRQGVRVLELPY